MKVRGDGAVWREWHDEVVPLRLGVSTCLLGESVRFDGGHARDNFVVQDLGAWVQWVPICPEVEIGMGTPRPSVRIVDINGDLRLLAPATGTDYSERMRSYADSRVERLISEELDGYVLKKNSPSCGMERVPIYGQSGERRGKGAGLFAAHLRLRWPRLPVEEEGRLCDPALRDSFVERIFCHNRWRLLRSRGLSRRALVRFHEAHKQLLRTHGEKGYGELGRLVGSAGKLADNELYERYRELFFEVIERHSTRGAHINVLMHVLGYLKNVLDAAEKRSLLGALEDFRRRLVPLAVPLALLRFQIDKYAVDYLRGQLYLEPHPKELKLRSVQW